MADEKPALEIVSGKVVVAGYFEQGALRPVTFAEYMQLLWDSQDGLPPAYLQFCNGFAGVILVSDIRGVGPDFVLPKFTNPMKAVQ